MGGPGGSHSRHQALCSDRPCPSLAPRPRPCLPACPHCGSACTGPGFRATLLPIRGLVLCWGSPPFLQRPQDLLSWGVSEKAHVSPQLLPSSQSSHVNISLLRAQRLGGCVSGPKARQRNVPGAPAPAASAVRGWAGFSGFSQCRAFVLRGNCTEGPGSPVLLGHLEHLWQISPGVLGVPRPHPPPHLSPPGNGV